MARPDSIQAVANRAPLNWSDLAFDTSNPEVYPPKPATVLLAKAACETVQPGDVFLEVGTGSGAVAIAVAHCVPQARVTASDINEQAIAVAGINERRNGVDLELVLGDMFEPFAGRLFDVIAMHPPAVPYPLDATWGMTHGMTLATNGGADGSRLVVEFVTKAAGHLKSNGKLLLLLPHWSNTRKAYQALLGSYAQVTQLDQEKIEFFPVTEGRPDKALLDYVRDLAEAGAIELTCEDGKIYSRATVLLAVKA